MGCGQALGGKATTQTLHVPIWSLAEKARASASGSGGSGRCTPQQELQLLVCIVKRSLAIIVFDFQAGPSLDQNFSHLLVIVLDSPKEWRAAFRVLGVHIETLTEEELNNVSAS
eukprot:CAMPEP_0195027154 /NCGR_PEP_ID=MMETSP0326_2-20130528/51772_1 /TAXON_ID=2866 ORGANISM="Crypthecodinium cohnii, Strain Seligo" /NCGR_SAMPLE_ID=MMETSP0326_2 /ASSEMBLY_ACC=CAM_ASM_000348 /LENGTH=113 /DNA_ID=CAMNT_0040049259 /DNA_START=233 /DNA_END=571 /DNA_ORIENTATION=-